MAVDKFPWERIKREYITTDCTYAELAEQYGPSESQLRKRASAEKWTAERNKYRTTTEQITLEKTAEKTAEKISEANSEINARHFDMWAMVIEKTSKHLETPKELDQLESVARILERAQKGQRLAKEMDKPEEKQNGNGDNPARYYERPSKGALPPRLGAE